MTWDTYYEKINDWAVSTAINRISSLENIGSPDEVIDAIGLIALESESGATRLLNKALQLGIRFSGEDLTELIGICSDESLHRAVKQSADRFTAQDLESLYGCVDEEWIAEAAKQHHLRLPKIWKILMMKKRKIKKRIRKRFSRLSNRQVMHWNAVPQHRKHFAAAEI